MEKQEVELALSATQLFTRCAQQRQAFILDGGDENSWGCGRAVLSFAPHATLRIAADGASYVDDDGRQPWSGDPFDLLDRFCAQWLRPRPSAARFAGGVIVALSYELRHWVERVPSNAVREHDLPVLYAAYYDWLLSYSYAHQRYEIASAQRSAGDLRQIADRLNALVGQPQQHRRATQEHPRSDLTRDDYVAAIKSALAYIAAGDVYQINLAQRFVVESALRPAQLFAAMQRHTVPFGACVDAGDFALISNSPECFLTLEGNRISTFPIKGTRRRGRNCRTDHDLSHELERDPKERAEHVMIVDLERNDLGRICQTGSVHVEEFARVHSFPSVHHLVSKVSGVLRPGTSLANILRAVFPGGSITGAPKIRAMQLIDELEPVSREFYTGAIGFIGLDGSAVFNLAIRTAIAVQGRVSYHAGGGIVADSDPQREYDETLLKAQPFLAGFATATR